MRNMKFKQAFAYRFRDSLAGTGVFFGIMLLVLIGISVITAVKNAEMNGLSMLSLPSFAFSAGIVIFIFGICTVREDMRVMNQHGVGRRSTFLAGLLTALVIAAIMTAFGVLLLLLTLVIEGGADAIRLSAFFEDPALQKVGAGMEIIAIGLLGTVLTLLLAHLGGAFLSLLFYRLPKVWKVIVGIALPLFVLNGLPIFVFVHAEAFAAFMQIVFSSVWSALGFLALLCALVTLFNWLLMRRAPIRSAK